MLKVIPFNGMCYHDRLYLKHGANPELESTAKENKAALCVES